MSILIKGLDMPKDGNSIDISVQDSGAVLVKSSEGYYEYKGNIAVEIPTPHGRLIDESKVVSRMLDSYMNAGLHGEDYKKVCKYIKQAPTILEAEE